MNANQAVEQLLGGRVTGVRQGGGSIYLVAREGGEVVVAKRGTGTGATAAETAGLRWLRGHPDVPIPDVQGHDDEWIILQYIPLSPPSKPAAEEFGRGLAKLHLRGAPAFG